MGVRSAGLGFRVLVEKLGALLTQFEYLHHTPKADVIAFCNLLNAINDERNAIVHSAWIYVADEQRVERYKRSAKPRSGFEAGNVLVTPDEILAVAERCRTARERLWAIAAW
jgi:hypothetical protein